MRETEYQMSQKSLISPLIDLQESSAEIQTHSATLSLQLDTFHEQVSRSKTFHLWWNNNKRASSSWSRHDFWVEQQNLHETVVSSLIIMLSTLWVSFWFLTFLCVIETNLQSSQMTSLLYMISRESWSDGEHSCCCRSLVVDYSWNFRSLWEWISEAK